MKKTLIASAIAASFASGAFAADNLPTIYGNIQLTTVYADAEVSNIGGVSGAEFSDSDYDFVDNGSTIGLKHEHEIAPGLTGYLKAEFEFDASNRNSDSNGGDGGIGETDEAYLGLKGDFGNVWAGTNDTLYEDWIEDTTDLYEYLYMVGSYAGANLGNHEDNTVQYVSPSFGGLELGLAVQINGQQDDAPDTDGIDENNVTAGLKFSMEGLTIAGAFSDNQSDAGSDPAYGFAASYEMDAFYAGLTYESQEEAWNTATLIGKYTMGANQFMLSYSMGEEDGTGRDGETSVISAQALHNLSDNMYVYVEGQFEDDDEVSDVVGADEADIEGNALALGATYVF